MSNKVPGRLFVVNLFWFCLCVFVSLSVCFVCLCGVHACVSVFVKVQ